MDYKEKYEALLANIKAYHARFGPTCNLKKELEECVPELRESEDERIRKNILALVKKHAVNHERCQMEAYLEKQKEQIRAEIAPNQFDGITYGMQGCSTAMPAERTINKWAGSKRGLPPGTRTMFPIKGDDDNDLDLALDILQRTLGQADGYQSDDGILEHKRAIMAVTDAMNAKPAEWSEEDERMRKEIVDFIRWAVDRGSITKAQRERSDSWLSYLDKLKEKSEKPIIPGWSAADDEMLDAMIDMVSNSLYEPLCPREGMLVWLKSLRHQPNDANNEIAWKKYEDGHRFDSDTVVIGLNRSEPRLVRCAVSACYGIAVKDLLKLPFCL